MSRATTIADSIFREKGGVLRTSEAIAQGIHPRTLYALRDSRIPFLRASGSKMIGLWPYSLCFVGYCRTLIGYEPCSDDVGYPKEEHIQSLLL
jgi:hypothetical protein